MGGFDNLLRDITGMNEAHRLSQSTVREYRRLVAEAGGDPSSPQDADILRQMAETAQEPSMFEQLLEMFGIS